ncbi:hypothetical protein QZH56_17855 [Streptomyces olivoreticuli]|uniref:hypothetical protein n=1 Tax=Streptomyces olivoreticuli TaxID=68246 RepID=UPI0026580997|nr:hypothetical protein [Streptomyces olivoreticuli]WKK27289.1 hypothetical protein QZH56_17855 [Streptomyces olivoreticuli]
MHHPARVLAQAAGTALAVAVLALPRGASASAGDVGELEVTPGTVRPGAMVTVNTTACGGQGHGTGDASAVGGPATFELRPAEHKAAATGHFMVPQNAQPGAYGLGAQCANGKEAAGDVTVATGSASASAAAGNQAPLGPGTAPAHPPRPARVPVPAAGARSQAHPISWQRP